MASTYLKLSHKDDTLQYINLCIHYPLVLSRTAGVLEPILAVIQGRVRYTQDRSPVWHTETDKRTHGPMDNLEGRRKPEYLENPRRPQRTQAPHRKATGDLWTFYCGVKVLTTTPTCHPHYSTTKSIICHTSHRYIYIQRQVRLPTSIKCVV